jgi:peptide deformylase
MILYNDIIKEENQHLRQKSVNVEIPLNKEDQETIELMNQYLTNGYDDEFEFKDDIRAGVGISAVQIDVLKKIFVIMAYDEEGTFHHYGVINPKIISHSEQLAYLESGEGCLSVDRKVEGLIFRPKKVKAKCYLYDFDTKETVETVLTLRGYLAVVFQHEYDHLQGILFIDHINKENPFAIPENATPIKFEE